MNLMYSSLVFRTGLWSVHKPRSDFFFQLGNIWNPLFLWVQRYRRFSFPRTKTGPVFHPKGEYHPTKVSPERSRYLVPSKRFTQRVGPCIHYFELCDSHRSLQTFFIRCASYKGSVSFTFANKSSGLNWSPSEGLHYLTLTSTLKFRISPSRSRHPKRTT